jgi:hypothetical protein
MKHSLATLLTLAIITTPAVFGQALFDFESDEADLTLNSAEEVMSGPINITIEHDPLEDESDAFEGNIDDVFNSADDIFDIGDATEVETGPVANIALILSALMLAGIIAYRVRQSRS